MTSYPEPSLVEPERKSVAVCCACNMTIQEGEDALRVDEGYIHFDKECMLGYADMYLSKQELSGYLDFEEVVL